MYEKKKINSSAHHAIFYLLLLNNNNALKTALGISYIRNKIHGTHTTTNTTERYLCSVL